MQVFGGAEARPDLLQLARLGGEIALVDVLCHVMQLIGI